MKRIAILISGRGTNLQALIDAEQKGLINGRISIVISNDYSAFGLERAKNANIPTEVFQDEEILLRKLCEEKIDLLVLAGYMKILSRYFIQVIKIPIINIHPSLLPSFPGLNAQKQAILYGVKISGCTTHFVDEGVDTGPIILQKQVEVDLNETEKSLGGKILVQEHSILIKTVQLFCNDKLKIDGRNVIIKE